MLTAEVKAYLTSVKIDPAKLEAAAKDEKEVAVDIPKDITVLDEAGLKTVKDSEYASGKLKGVEMAVKEAKEKLGVETTAKTVDGLVKAATDKALADAKITPDAKVAELQKDLDKLRTENTTLAGTITEKDKTVSQAQTDRELFKQIPSLGENAPAVDMVIDIMRARGYDFQIQEGALVALKGGEVQKDKVAKLIPVKDIITGFAKEAKLLSDPIIPKGRGNEQKGPAAVYLKQSEIEAEFKASGKSTNGQEYSDAVLAAKKANADFDMNA